MIPKYLRLFFCLLALWLFSCDLKEVIPESVQGLAPIYSGVDWKIIQSVAPQPIQTLGKIYYKNGFLFVGEVGKGIHIIDNRNPSNPQRIKFLKIDGNTDIAIKGNILYANNAKDLVVMDISNLDEVKLLKRLPDVFPLLDGSDMFPAGYSGYFECVDSKRGIVIGWEETTLKNPECWR